MLTIETGTATKPAAPEWNADIVVSLFFLFSQMAFFKNPRKYLNEGKVKAVMTFDLNVSDT